MNKLIASLILIGFGTVFAAENDLNGDFEKCAADKNGILMPEGWINTKNSSPDIVCQVTLEKDEVHNGKFALALECDSGKQIYIRQLKEIPAKANDKINAEVFVMGKGTLALGYIVYGKIDDNYKFIRTVTFGSKNVNSEESYQKIDFNFTIPTEKDRKTAKLADDLKIIPIILVKNKSELFIDDLVFDIAKP